MSRQLLNSLGLAACCAIVGACERAPAVSVSPTSEAAAPTCVGAERFADSWTAARRAELEASFASFPGEWPMQLLEAVDAHVLARAPAWEQAYLEACDASDEGRQHCLDEELWQLEAALSLSEGDADWAARAWAQLDASLDARASCSDAGAGASAASPEQGRAWAALRLERRTLDGQARAQALGLRLADAQFAVEPRAPAHTFEYDAAQAIVAHAEGNAGARDAALAHMSEVAAELGPRWELELLWLRAQLDDESPLEAARTALLAARALDEPNALLASLHALGRAQLRARDHEGALAPLTEAIAVSTRLAGAESPRVAEVQLTLAKVLTAQGKIEAAYDLLTQARDSLVAELGPDHPATLASVEAIGALFMAAGQPGDAQYAYLDLLDIYDQLYGAKDWRVARVKLELGDSLMAMEQFRGARTMYSEALTLLVQALGPDSRAAIRASVHLGVAALKLDLLDEAAEHCGRGVKLVKALAADDPLAGEAELCMTQLAVAQKRAKRRKRK